MYKPARVQVSKSELDEAAEKRQLEQQQQQQPSAVFNSWYGKWAGGDKQHTRFRSLYRCDPKLDSGYTKAQGPYFCIWFARGTCYKGHECVALHRIPEKEDTSRVNNTTDCFGRTKHADYREDMAGVGSLLEENKTLFVGYFDHGSALGSKLADQIRLQFAAWGDVDQVRLGKNNTIAFVSYSSELNAQFAKEAMSNQSITGHETLLVRWSRNSSQREQRSRLSRDSEEDRIRQIVKQVIKERREIEEATTEYKKRPAEKQTGLLSAEAISKIRHLKKRKTEIDHPREGQSRMNEQLMDPQSRDSKTPEIMHTNSTSQKRGGLVDYD